MKIIRKTGSMKNRKYNLNSVLDFGKYKSQTIKDVIDTNKSYIYWCMENVSSFSLSQAALDYLNGNVSECDEYETTNDEYEACSPHDDYDVWPYEKQHYTKYAGTYASDMEHLSDEFIDIALDGCPDAYWNID